MYNASHVFGSVLYTVMHSMYFWAFTFGHAFGVALNIPIEHGSDARLGGVHFSGPPCFGPLGIFIGFFIKFGACGLELL